MTSSATLAGNFGCGSIGMPRPLSRTVSAVAGVELELDALGVAGHRLVHGVVQHLGDQMVQRPLVGAADIHAGAPADRLQALQHLDVVRGVAVAAGALAGKVEQVGHALRSMVRAYGRSDGRSAGYITSSDRGDRSNKNRTFSPERCPASTLRQMEAGPNVSKAG